MSLNEPADNGASSRVTVMDFFSIEIVIYGITANAIRILHKYYKHSDGLTTLKLVLGMMSLVGIFLNEFFLDDFLRLKDQYRINPRDDRIYFWFVVAICLTFLGHFCFSLFSRQAKTGDSEMVFHWINFENGCYKVIFVASKLKLFASYFVNRRYAESHFDKYWLLWVVFIDITLLSILDVSIWFYVRNILLLLGYLEVIRRG